VKVISPVSYELMLPGTMQVHPVFHVSHLRTCQNPNYPMDILPASNSDKEEFQVEKILTFKVDNFLRRYAKGPCLLFLVRWSPPYTSKDDSWEPYVLLKNVDALHDFVANNESFRTFVLSSEYDRLRQHYPARFPVFA
jgi:hypothetical protein